MLKIEVPNMWDSLLPLPRSPLVTMVVVNYNRPYNLPVILNSLRCQTYQNFEVIVVHDGKNDENRKIVEDIGDDRFVFIETDERYGGFGYKSRMLGTELAKGEFIGHTNDDNYYVPVYFEAMLSKLLNEEADIVYCNMVSSYNQWYPFETYPKIFGIDAGGWIAKTELARATEWINTTATGDGIYFEDMMKKAKKVVKVNNYLFVHN
jgi:GT2 family glycosyltransferase